NGAAQVNILSAGELGVKSSADFQQTPDPAMNFGAPGCGSRNSREDFQEGRLSCAVPPDQANDLSLANIEGNVTQRPQVINCSAAARRPKRTCKAARQHIAKCQVSFALAYAIALAEIFSTNDNSAHISYDIGDRRLHALKVGQAAYKDHYHSPERDKKQSPRSLPVSSE